MAIGELRGQSAGVIRCPLMILVLLLPFPSAASAPYGGFDSRDFGVLPAESGATRFLAPQAVDTVVHM